MTTINPPSVITSTGYKVNNTDLINYLPVAYGSVITISGTNNSNYTISASEYYNASVALNTGGGTNPTFTITVTDTTLLKGICILSMGYTTSPLTPLAWTIQSQPTGTTGVYNIWVSSGGGSPSYGWYVPFNFIIY